MDVKPRIGDESMTKSRIWKLTEINEPSQCRSLRLPDNLTAMRVHPAVSHACTICFYNYNASIFFLFIFYMLVSSESTEYYKSILFYFWDIFIL